MALDVLVAEVDVIVMLDVVLELVLLEVDDAALDCVEEEHVHEELVLALVLLWMMSMFIKRSWMKW